MLPEASLMAILVITFLVDFFTAKKPADTVDGNPRKWFNCLVCVLMLIHICLNIAPTAPATAVGGMYATGAAQGVIDVCFREGDGFVLLDYKTDRVIGDPAQWAQRHRRQVELYARALTTLTGRPVVEKYVVFLNGRACVRL